MVPKIIAFGHKWYTGKDTAVSLLTTHLRMTKPGICIRKGSFADELKFNCFRLYSWAGHKHPSHYDDFPQEKDQVLPILGMTPREIWIKFGTKAVREQVYDGTWVQYLLHNLPDCNYLFIQDVRFRTEADEILKQGGMIFKVECAKPFIPPNTNISPEYQKIINIADDPLNDYTLWTDIIQNNGTLKEFNQTIIDLAKKWGI